MNGNTDILLVSGTNELAILEFMIDGNLYGINVAKVREIMKYMPVNPMQKSNPNIEGIFKPREDVITVVDLSHYLGLGKSDHLDSDVFIITNFSRESYAFHVHEVVGISRVSWKHLQKPDEIIYGGSEGIATAIAEYDGRLITILDFEKIVSEINPESGIQLSSFARMGNRPTNNTPILFAEDSMMLGRLVMEGLKQAGYTNVTRVFNGQEAWDHLLKMRESGAPLKELVSLVITDIEMPVMDGHCLIHQMQEEPDMRDIPVVIFSSLMNEQLLSVGEQLGAVAQFAKPDLMELIKYIDGLTLSGRV